MGKKAAKVPGDRVSDRFDIRGETQLTLEDLLADHWRLSYLKSFTEAELSNENVAFMVRVREFEAAVTAGDAQARALGDTIFDSHIKAGAPEEMAVTARLREQLKQALKQWKEGTSSTAEVSVSGLLASTYQTVYRNVSFDVLPRFLASEHAIEMAKLHPSKAMLYEPSREVFERSIDEDGDDWLALWLAAHEYFERYMSLASGWPTEETSQRAARLVKLHRKTMAKLCGEAELKGIQRQVGEAPLELFDTARLSALNAIQPSWALFLDTEDGGEYVKSAGITERVTKEQHPPAFVAQSRKSDDPNAESDEYDYTAGW
mmetsp:Transcript_33484/g.99648  ORF Transcript_33484/g.99648 Transcript_33484/m.99648 type:complete len:318 (+) Transcript_33484:73-1026(+)